MASVNYFDKQRTRDKADCMHRLSWALAAHMACIVGGRMVSPSTETFERVGLGIVDLFGALCFTWNKF